MLRIRDVVAAILLIGWLVAATPSLLDVQHSSPSRGIDYPQGFDPVYAGTEEGRVLELRPNESTDVILNANDRFEVDALSADEDKLVVLGNRITEQTHNSTLFLMNGGSATEIGTSRHVEDIALARDNIYVTAHRHDSSTKDGTLTIYGLDGDKTKEVKHKAASKMSKGDGKLAVSGDDGDLMVVNLSTNNVLSSFSYGDALHDAAPANGSVLLASTKRRPAAITGYKKVGSISRVSMSGREISSFDLGVTSLPHDVNIQGDDVLLIDIQGQIRKLNAGLDGRGVSTDLPGRPIDLAISGNSAYVLDERNDTLSRVDISNMVVKDRAAVPRVTAVTSD